MTPKGALLLLSALLVLVSCKTLDDRYHEVSAPTSELRVAGTMVIHDRSVTTGENYLDVHETPPKPKAGLPTNPSQVTIEANVVLLKRGTMVTSAPYELSVEGSLEGKASGEFGLDLLYDVQHYAGNGRIATVKLPWSGALDRISWSELNEYASVPLRVQGGRVGDAGFELKLTRSVPFHEDPSLRWTWGLVVLPLAELITALDPQSPTSVNIQRGFVSSRQRFQMVGGDGVVWGELEGDTYRVFDAVAAPPADDVIRVLAMVRLEVWMYKQLITSKPPKTRNVRYLTK